MTNISHRQFTNIRNYFIHMFGVASIGRSGGLRSLNEDHWKKHTTFRNIDGNMEEVRIINPNQKGRR